MKHILQTLDITQYDFKVLCAVSGTDYNTNSRRDMCELYKIFKPIIF